MEWLQSEWFGLFGLIMAFVGMLSYSAWGIVILLYGVGIMLFKLNILFASMVLFTISFYLIIFKLTKHYSKDKDNRNCLLKSAL